MGITTEPSPNRAFGFSFVEIIIAVAVVGLLVALGAFGYRAFVNGDMPGTPPTSGSQCEETNGVDFCVKSSAPEVSPSDGLTLDVSLTNHRPVPYSTERVYSSSCNDPSITINGKDVYGNAGLCTQDITAITIAAGATRKYKLAVGTDDLKTGRNVIKLSWDTGRLTSKSIVVILKERSATDDAREQSCLGEQVLKPYCASITIVFKDGGGSATCEQLEEYIKPLGLAAVRSDCQMSDYGIMTTYVPESEADEWVSKIQGISQVQSVSKF